MKDINTYIKEVYEKAKTMPEMELINMGEEIETNSEEYTFNPEFKEMLRQALLEYANSDTYDKEEYPEVKFSQRHEQKMQKLFKKFRKQVRKQNLKEYRKKRCEIRKKITEKKRLKKLKYSDKKNKPSSK